MLGLIGVSFIFFTNHSYALAAKVSPSNRFSVNTQFTADLIKSRNSIRIAIAWQFKMETT